jgi:tetratricopeptide (TPR) repeat protein
MSSPRFLDLKKLGVFCLFFALSFANVRAANGDLPATGAVPAETNPGSNESLRAYLQLQDQLHDTQMALERNRMEVQAASAQASMTLSNRLQAIEQSLLVQRASELDEAQRTNRLMLVVLGIFAVVGLAAALFTIYFQSRAVSRLADISTALSSSRGLGFPSAGAISLGDHEAMSNGAVEQSNSRLMNLVQHLEKRIAELEQTTTLPLKESTLPSNGNTPGHPELALDVAADEKPSQIVKLLEQGQSLLTGDRPEEAIAAFDEVLAIDPNHAEALVKKGTALEKLRQPQEALEYYDRAIAVDGSLTIAYLHKGGLCSRLEKYGEAMECYERALHTQEKKRAA